MKTPLVVIVTLTSAFGLAAMAEDKAPAVPKAAPKQTKPAPKPKSKTSPKASATPTPSPSVSASPTASSETTPETSPSPDVSPSASPTASVTPDVSPSPSTSPSESPIPTASASPAAAPSKPDPYAKTAARSIPSAIQSEFSARIPELYTAWPPKNVPPYKDDMSPVWMVGMSSAKNPEYLGVKKRLYFKVPKDVVDKAMVKFDEYTVFLDGMVSVVKSSDVVPGIDHLVDFRRSAPVFFLADERYRMAYANDVKDPTSFFRYQLIKGGHLMSSDGLIGVSKAPDNPNHTVLTAYDFFNIDFGPIRAFAEGSLIARCFNDSYRNDLALVIKTENPTFDRTKIWETVDVQVARFPLGDVKMLPPGQF